MDQSEYLSKNGTKFHLTKDGSRSAWLSFAGGISVAYVFIHIFPELELAQRHISSQWEFIPFIERHAYLVALPRTNSILWPGKRSETITNKTRSPCSSHQNHNKYEDFLAAYYFLCHLQCADRLPAGAQRGTGFVRFDLLFRCDGLALLCE